MSKFSLAEHGSSLFSIDGMRHAVESAASNPKVATIVAGTSVGMGYKSSAMIETVIGQVTLIVGCITAVIVMVIQGIKLARMLKGKE